MKLKQIEDNLTVMTFDENNFSIAINSIILKNIIIAVAHLTNLDHMCMRGNTGKDDTPYTLNFYSDAIEIKINGEIYRDLIEYKELFLELEEPKSLIVNDVMTIEKNGESLSFPISIEHLRALIKISDSVNTAMISKLHGSLSVTKNEEGKILITITEFQKEIFKWYDKEDFITTYEYKI